MAVERTGTAHLYEVLVWYMEDGKAIRFDYAPVSVIALSQEEACEKAISEIAGRGISAAAVEFFATIQKMYKGYLVKHERS